ANHGSIPHVAKTGPTLAAETKIEKGAYRNETVTNARRKRARSRQRLLPKAPVDFTSSRDPLAHSRARDRSTCGIGPAMVVLAGAAGQARNGNPTRRNCILPATSTPNRYC